MEQPFSLKATPLAAALYRTHNPPREYERMSPYRVSTALKLAAAVHGTDSAVIKTGYTLMPHTEAKYRPSLARLIGSRRPLRYFQTLLRRIGEDLLKTMDVPPTHPYLCYCGAVDASIRKEAYKKRYPPKQRRNPRAGSQAA